LIEYRNDVAFQEDYDILSEKYANSIREIIVLKKLKSPDRTIDLLNFIIGTYIKEGLSSVEFNVRYIENALDTSATPAKKLLENLAELEVIKAVEKKFPATYSFPNTDFDVSLFAPIRNFDKTHDKWHNEWYSITQEQVKKIKNKTTIHRNPFANLDREKMFDVASTFFRIRKKLDMFSQTPGIILPEEYNSPDNPSKKAFYKSLKQSLKEGLKMRLVFNYHATIDAMKKYDSNHLKEIPNHYEEFYKLENLDVWYVKEDSFPSAILTEDAVILGVRNEESDATATKGLLVYDEFLVKYFNKNFDDLRNDTKNIHLVDESVLSEMIRECRK